MRCPWCFVASFVFGSAVAVVGDAQHWSVERMLLLDLVAALVLALLPPLPRKS